MLRELAHREGDGLVVTLHWDDEDDVVVLHLKDGDRSFHGLVGNDRAMDAFHHPFLYVDVIVEDKAEVVA